MRLVIEQINKLSDVICGCHPALNTAA